MSRASRITEGLARLQRAKVIESFARMPGEAQTRWLVQIDGVEYRYLTGSEAEAFIDGADASMSAFPVRTT